MNSDTLNIVHACLCDLKCSQVFVGIFVVAGGAAKDQKSYLLMALSSLSLRQSSIKL